MTDDPAIKAGVDAARDAIKGGYQGRTLEHLVQIGIEAARPIIEAEILTLTWQRFHIPQVAQKTNDVYGVFCAACSAAVGDYIYPCKVIPIGFPPEELRRAAVRTEPEPEDVGHDPADVPWGRIAQEEPGE